MPSQTEIVMNLWYINVNFHIQRLRIKITRRRNLIILMAKVMGYECATQKLISNGEFRFESKIYYVIFVYMVTIHHFYLNYDDAFEKLNTIMLQKKKKT